MKFWIFVLVGLSWGVSSVSAAVASNEPANFNWEVESITFYSEMKQGQKISVSREVTEADLGRVTAHEIRSPLLTEIFNSAIRVYGQFLWKGRKYGVVKLKNNVTKKIYVSWYGSFFKLEGSEYTFRFEGKAAGDWERIVMGREEEAKQQKSEHF